MSRTPIDDREQSVADQHKGKKPRTESEEVDDIGPVPTTDIHNFLQTEELMTTTTELPHPTQAAQAQWTQDEAVVTAGFQPPPSASACVMDISQLQWQLHDKELFLNSLLYFQFLRCKCEVKIESSWSYDDTFSVFCKHEFAIFTRNTNFHQNEMCSFIRKHLSLVQPTTASSSSTESSYTFVDEDAAKVALCRMASRVMERPRICGCMQQPLQAMPPTVELQRSSKAFQYPYRGPLQLALLYGQLKKVAESTSEYAPMLTILQHSCSGKSRMMTEFGLVVCPVIYICFQIDEMDGYPNSVSSALREYLLFSDNRNNRKKVALSEIFVFLRYVAFLLASVDLIDAFWSQNSLKDEHGNVREAELKEKLGVFLNKQLSQNRLSDASTFNALCTLSKKYEDLFANNGKIVTLAEAKETSTTDPSTKPNIWDALEAALVTILEQIVRSRSPTLSGREGEFLCGLLCIDEERIFQEYYTETARTGVKQSLSSHFLRATRVLRSIAQSRILVVRMDTRSDLEVLKPRNDFNPSTRLMSNENHMSVFHLMITRHIGALQLKEPADVAGRANDMAYMSHFGSPVWYSTMIANRTTMPLGELYSMAKRKIQGGRRVIDPNKIDSEVSAALIGATASLDIDPFSKLSEELVSSYMAQMTYWDRKSNRCDISYPADAVLAKVAGDLLFDEGCFHRHIENICDLLSHKYISSGDIGELVARLLLLYALRFQAKRARVSAMTVEEFLLNLLGRGSDSSAALARFERLTETQKQRDSLEQLQQGVVNVKQFVTASGVPTREELCLAARRGYAFIAQRNQAYFNLCIPVILKQPVYVPAAKAAAGEEEQGETETAARQQGVWKESKKQTASRVSIEDQKKEEEEDQQTEEEGEALKQAGPTEEATTKDDEKEETRKRHAGSGSSNSSSSNSSSSSRNSSSSSRNNSSSSGKGFRIDSDLAVSRHLLSELFQPATFNKNKNKDSMVVDGDEDSGLAAVNGTISYEEVKRLVQDSSQWLSILSGPATSLLLATEGTEKGHDKKTKDVRKKKAAATISTTEDTASQPDHLFLPAYVSYIAIEVKFRSGVFPLEDPVDPWETIDGGGGTAGSTTTTSEVLQSDLARMSLKLIFDASEDGVVIPSAGRAETRRRSELSPLVAACIRNPHEWLPDSMKRALKSLLTSQTTKREADTIRSSADWSNGLSYLLNTNFLEKA